MKRNLVSEIESIRNRTILNDRRDITNRLNKIELILNNPTSSDKNKLEILKYVPIATIAAMESYFRSVYKELIDLGSPYSENVSKFNQSKNIKFDFEMITAIHSKSITSGELISHMLSCNNFEDINSNMSTLLQNNFALELKNFDNSNRVVWGSLNVNEFAIKNADIIQSIRRTFELRHIFCHEYGSNIDVTEIEIRKCYDSCRIFLEQTNNYLWATVYPNMPNTMPELISQTENELNSQKQLLNDLIVEFKNFITIQTELVLDTELLEKTIESWHEYSQKRARFDSSEVAGGSLEYLLTLQSLTKSTKEFYQSLKTDLNTKKSELLSTEQILGNSKY